MSLIECSVCRKEISQYAYQCPHCKTQNIKREKIEDISIIGDNYEEKYFSYIARKKRKEKEEKLKNKKLLKRVVLLVGIIIIAIVMSIFFSKQNSKKQINEERELMLYMLDVHEDLTAKGLQATPETLPEDIVEYITNGITMFGNVEGELEFVTTAEYDWDNSVRFYAKYSDDTYEYVVDQLVKMYGEPTDFYYQTSAAHQYSWEKPDIEIVLYQEYAKLVMYWRLS